MNDVVSSGEPCWVDLSADDVGAAERFYRELLGWTTTTVESSMGEYHVGSVGGREVAGMMGKSPEMAGAPSMWTVFVFVEDLDATLELVRSAGGGVLQPPFEIPGDARVSVVAGVGGAMFALISARPQPGPYLVTDVGAVGWVELMTRDTEAAMRFYEVVFGWAAETQDANGTMYTTFRLGGREVAGMIPTPDHLPPEVPDAWSVYFNVESCSAALERIRSLGGSVILGPMPTPMGPFAVAADPEGAIFQLMEFTAG